MVFFLNFAILNLSNIKKIIMGKGDKKTGRGKIFMGSFGVTRPRKKKKYKAVKTEEKPQE
jgi:30S ribosomal protein S31